MSAGPAAGPEVDRRLMRRAAELARRGWGRVAPNPMVGAVVAREGRVVGEGWHAEFGGPHAEVMALSRAGAEAAGATLYVTLEPCTHTGKTLPCAPAVAAAGVTRVVVGCLDPDLEAGGGAAVLRAAGVVVATGVEPEVCARLLSHYLWNRLRRPPFVALKLALSLDGALAREPGVRTTVTGPDASAWVHRLRAGFDAILVGRGTVAADDPLLTVRGDIEPRRPPVRVVLDSEASVSPRARLVGSAREVPTWILCAPGAPAERRNRLEAAGARVIETPEGPGGLSVGGALDRLAKQGVGTVLAEGGGRVARSLLEAGRVQRLHLLVAPVLFGAGAPAGFGGAASTPGEWRVAERAPLGQDTRMALDSRELTEVLEGPGPETAAD